jgi:hypothetical protein
LHNWPVLEDLVARYPHNILLGDFNSDILSASQRSSDLVSELNWIALTVVSKEPTQFQATVIDLFITDEPGLVRTISQFTLSGMDITACAT